MPRRPQKHGCGLAPAARGKTAERGYGGRWQRYRLTYLRAHPLCAECRKTGRVTAAEHVDHVRAVSGAEDPLFWDAGNHQGLCASCHSRKTAAEDGGFGRG